MSLKFMSVPLLFFMLMLSCEKKYQPRTLENVELQYYTIDSTSIRAIEIIDDSTVWYAGSEGAYGYISGGKITQYRIKTLPDSSGHRAPHFRSIAFNGKAVFALTIENPAVLYKLNGSRPETVYREDHPKVFYDAMTFFDTQNGIAFGDPTGDCPSVIITRDGGNSWHKLNCSGLPGIEEGEAAFAASNTNIAVVGENAWLVTGGKKARVFHTPDKGKSWEVYDTPVIQGKPTTGIYSVAFYDKNNGIVFGGDYTDKKGEKANKAVTTNGGKTWKLVAEGEEPGYISCVQYVPGTGGMELFAVSTEGIYFSNDRGHHWKKVSGEGFYSIRILNPHTAWLSSQAKMARMTF